MNFDSHAPQPTAPESTALSAAILYEDFRAGVRARKFVDSLSEALGQACNFDGGLWRPELLEFQSLAQEAERRAKSADFLIISVRGDSSLSHCTKDWIETWLEIAGSRGACVIALFDPQRSNRKEVDTIRCYLRNVAGAHNVGFFSHSDVRAEMEDSADFPQGEQAPPARDRGSARRRRVPGLLAA